MTACSSLALLSINPATCEVVFGTYDPAMARPPIRLSAREMPNSRADSGGIDSIPSLVETNAAPALNRNLVHDLQASWNAPLEVESERRTISNANLAVQRD